MSSSKQQAAQFEYEYFGRSLNELSQTYGFPVNLLELWEPNWTRRLEVQDLPQTTDITTFAEALEQRTRSQLTVVALFRQIEQQPMLAQIERLILEKTVTVLENLTHLDDKAASKITSLVTAIQSLRQQSPVELADKIKDAAQSGGLTVNIQNNIQ